MSKIKSSSKDYRRLADEVWEKAKIEQIAGHSDLANILKEAADKIHDLARKKYVEEEKLKKLN